MEAVVNESDRAFVDINGLSHDEVACSGFFARNVNEADDAAFIINTAFTKLRQHHERVVASLRERCERAEIDAKAKRLMEETKSPNEADLRRMLMEAQEQARLWKAKALGEPETPQDATRRWFTDQEIAKLADESASGGEGEA